MMWSWEKSPVNIAEKTRRIEELEIELARKTNETVDLKSKLDKVISDARSVSFAFDFKAVKAFSVERNIGNDGIPVTIIGYMLEEPVVVSEGETTTKDVVREWYLNCDDKQHEAIVKAFKESRND